MNDYKTFFKGKKITLMGLGLLGRGVGDAEFLAKLGADLLVTDLKSEAELATSLKKLKKYKNIRFVLGEHRIEDFRDRDLILKAAGVPFDSAYIAEAKKNNIPVAMSADLFARFSNVPIIGVTGTRGKSTTTAMIQAILKAAKKKVILGGNVRGISTLSLLPSAAKADYALFELDSWQLQGFGDARMSPKYSVFTNFLDDHLNYYRGDKELYFKDKANIFVFQKNADVLIASDQVLSCAKEYGFEAPGKLISIKKKTLPKDWELKLPGDHSRENAALALALARELGINDTVSKKALREFSGVSGRLELVRKVKGVEIYNDTTATTPIATQTALRALGKKKNIVLIMGGFDKTLDMNDLLKELSKYVKKVILIPGTGTDRIKDVVLKTVPKSEYVNTLAEAVSRGFKEAKKGDILLFSPAFASFGLFKNEFDRGDQFMKLVKKLK